MRLLTLLLLCTTTLLFAQNNTSYQQPPDQILELVDAPLAPLVLIDGKGENLVLLYRDAYKSINELSEKELRLAGLRINPVTNIGSRVRYYNNIEFKSANADETRKIAGLPTGGRYANIIWSPDESKVAFTNTTTTGVELWVADVKTAKASKLTSATINANLGRPMVWMKDGQSLLVKMLPENRPALIDPATAVPSGPIISESTEGQKAQNRTYQDLLQNKNDEQNFEILATSELYKVTTKGQTSAWLPAGMYWSVSTSPDGEYIMVSQLDRPFSYLVPYRRFPRITNIYNTAGKLVNAFDKAPLLEVLPKGFMATSEGKRRITWRADHPATLVWVEALDGGDPNREVAYRDEVWQLAAPFSGTPQSLLKTQNRYSRIDWATKNLAFASDVWWNTRNTKTYLFNPSDSKQSPKIITDRNYQDRYSDPGNLAKRKNKFNRNVVAVNDGKVFLMGAGLSEEGQFPFIKAMDTNTLETTTLYQSSYTDKMERIYDIIDVERGTYLVRVEGAKEYPNYYIRDISKDKLQPLTRFENPFKSLAEVEKQVITYPRADGVELEGTLYLPAGYDKSKKEKMPMIVWAYPVEFKDKKSAAQNTTNPNEFIYPYYGSPIYWATCGYVILDDAAFPIVGEGEQQPNDNFRKQLVDNAKAAIDAVDAMGYIDRERVAVGGHSYGAFMVANLLSHSDLFAAGIARSGAYNRTLTPFGFQAEERSYWDSPETYYNMSPFMHADKMKTPLLLIHGEADNNSGTYPLQSKRYFNALKGLGAPARLVMLPKESHGYRAKESILHMLWEQDQWLEKYVKNKK
ncbi:MAG: prolyl oligopeptidase family serine peptidase [Bacteroidota bacterium]